MICELYLNKGVWAKKNRACVRVDHCHSLRGCQATQKVLSKCLGSACEQHRPLFTPQGLGPFPWPWLSGQLAPCCYKFNLDGQN